MLKHKKTIWPDGPAAAVAALLQLGSQPEILKHRQAWRKICANHIATAVLIFLLIKALFPLPTAGVIPILNFSI